MRLAPLPLLLALAVVACGDGPDDPCALADPVTAIWRDPAPVEPPAASLDLSLELSQAVTGVEAGVTVLAEGAAIEAIEGGPAVYTVRLGGYDPGATITAELVPEAGGIRVARLDCPAIGLRGPASLDLTAPGDPWQHLGPITRAAPSPRVDPPWLVERTEEVGLDALGLDTGRAMIVDFDGDGREDLVTLPVTSTPLRPRFVRNVSEGGAVRFEDHTAESGMGDAQMALLVFGDVDDDGDPDAFAGLSYRAREGQGGIWENVGGGRFEHRGLAGTAPAELDQGFWNEAAAATFADFDRDGHLDLYVGHWFPASARGNALPSDDALYRGQGDGTFAAQTLPDQTNPLTLESSITLVGAGRAAYGLAAGDYDDDGDLDLFVNNYGAGRPALGSPPRYWDHNFLWRNDGDLRFVDTGTTAGVAATRRGIGGVEDEPPLVFQGRTWPAPIGGNGFGCQFADFDNDGDLDLVVGTIAHPDYRQSDRALLHVNQGPPEHAFTEESAARGLEYYEDELHPVLVDADNDGYLDLAMSRLRRGSKWRLYWQTADHRFELQAVPDTGVDVDRPGPTLWLDADRDGDLDLFMAKGGGRWFENLAGDGRNHLRLSLVGTAPRDATGAKVTLRSSAGTQVRFLTSGEGHYNTQQSRVLHFGLGGDSGAEDVRIRWPNGEVTTLGDVRANLHLRVTQGGGIELL